MRNNATAISRLFSKLNATIIKRYSRYIRKRWGARRNLGLDRCRIMIAIWIANELKTWKNPTKENRLK